MRRLLVGAMLAAGALPAAAAAHGGAEGLSEAQELRDSWTTAWSVPWVPLVFITVAAALYIRRARTLGPRLPKWRAACFAGGLVVLGLAGASPIDAVGEGGLFWVHMVQHLLIGDLAALLIVLGVTGPILQPVLQFRVAQKLRTLTHPMAACLIWAAILIGWHIPVLYEAALTNEWVHAVQHATFLAGGILMWAPLLETLPAPEWFGTGPKLAYVGAIRVVDAIMANVLWWSGSPLYANYEETAPLWGISALQDQGHAGTVMMAWTGTVTLIVGTVLFFRMAREGEVRQELIERGLDPDAVRRAVRYGRADILAARHGVTLGKP